MSSLYNKYRPQSFDDIVGNETTINTLKRLLSKPNHSHVLLFYGPPGTGKTTTARIIAKMLDAKAIIISEGGIGKPVDEIMLSMPLFCLFFWST